MMKMKLKEVKMITMLKKHKAMVKIIFSLMMIFKKLN